MISWYWLPLALGAFALAFVVIANFGTAEKRLQRRVARIPAVDDPAFTRTAKGIFATPFVPGTRIATLVNGDRIFPAMLSAIADAERSVNFETFICWSGDIDASRMVGATLRLGSGPRTSPISCRGDPRCSS